jgi:hypothetical protein
MSWPLSQDYNEAVQNPAMNFADPELKRCRAATNAMGLPMPYSGNFADVYQFVSPGGPRWAVKCFTREVAGLHARYDAISRHLRLMGLPFAVDFTYLEKGILVAGQWYPVLKMEWVEGLTLNEFVSRAADKPATLEVLLQVWGRMGAYLRVAHVAHADLQHGNVLLVPGTNALALKLVDYDGMWVPALAGSKSGEVGHPSYQHPQRLRDGTYSREVDRFPLLLVATALRALKTGGPALWEKYTDGDNLLFKAADLQAPTKSRLFYDLLHSTDALTVEMTKQVIEALRGSLESAPQLEDVMPVEARPLTKPTTRVKAVPVPKPQTSPPEEQEPAPEPPPVLRGPIIRPSVEVRRGKRRGVPVSAWAAGLVALVLIATAAVAVVFLRDGGAPHPAATDRLAERKPAAPSDRPHQATKVDPPENKGDPLQGNLASILGKREHLYQDKFDNSQRDWLRVKDSSGGEAGFADGMYYVSVPAKNKYFSPSLFQCLSDSIACEAVGRLDTVQGNGWGVRIGTGKRSIRVAFIGANRISVGSLHPDPKDPKGDPEDGPQGGPVEHQDIRPVNEWNTLWVVVRKQRHVEVYANGVLVLKPFDLDDPITPGTVSLCVLAPSRAARAEFKRFTVWSAEGLPPAPDDEGLAALLPMKGAGKPVNPPEPASEETSRVFNDKDLGSWEGLTAYWTVKDGVIVGAPPSKKPLDTFLCSTKTYKDFDLKFKVWRKYGKGTTAVQFRSGFKDRGQLTVEGPYCEIGPPYAAYPPGSLLIEPIATSRSVKADEAVSEAYKDAEFNDFRIRCVDKHVTIWVNDVLAIDNNFPDLPDEGIIAWHFNGTRTPDEVTFKDVVLKDLPREPTEKSPPLKDDQKPKESDKPKDDPPRPTDQVRATLDDALRKHDDAMADLDEKLRRKLDQEKEKAQKKGDKKQVDQIDVERMAFDKFALVPPSVPALAAKEYRQERDRARAAVGAAFKTATREYTKAKDQKKADEVEKEHKEFLKKHLTDAFRPGTVWNGSTEITVPGTAEKAITLTSKLTVQDRDETAFKAQFEDGDSARVVIGSIDNAGKLAWLAKNVVPIRGGVGDDHAGQLDRGAIVLRAEWQRPGDKKLVVAVTTFKVEVK